MDRWLGVLSAQSGFECTRDGEHGAVLVPRLTLQGDIQGSEFQLEVQIPTKTAFKLTINGKMYVCKCSDSPISPSAAYIEYANPGAPIRLVVAPGDKVKVGLSAAWENTRKESKSQVLFDGFFEVPDEPHRMGAAGYSVDVPALGAQAYFTVGRIGTLEENHLEILGFHLTLLY